MPLMRFAWAKLAVWSVANPNPSWRRERAAICSIFLQAEIVCAGATTYDAGKVADLR